MLTNIKSVTIDKKYFKKTLIILSNFVIILK